MTDSLTPNDMNRFEATLNMDKIDNKDTLNKTIDKQKNFPTSLKTFLKKELGKKIEQKDLRFQVSGLLSLKGKKLFDVDKVTKSLWSGKEAFFVRDVKGRFRTWGLFKIK